MSEDRMDGPGISLTDERRWMVKRRVLAQLDKQHDTTRMCVRSVVIHSGLTYAEAEAILRQSGGDCFISFNFTVTEVQNDR